MGDRVGVWLTCLIGLAMAVCGTEGGETSNPPGSTIVGRRDWWMFGRDAQYTRRSPFVGPQTARSQWTYRMGSQVESSPAIGADGTVYAGTLDGHLYAINPDGSLEWAYTTEDSVSSSPAIAIDGTVYVRSSDGKLYAFSDRCWRLADRT